MKKIIALALASASLLSVATAQGADLTIWGLQAFSQEADAKIGEMAEAFGEERGLDVDYVVVPANILSERLAAAFQGGAAPDVFMQVGQQAQYYAARGLTMPLDENLAEMRKVEGGVYENTIPQAMFEGKAHALPLEVDVVPMYARTDLLEEAGLAVPTTWEELRTAVQAIVKANPQIAGLGIPVSSANDAETTIRTLVWSFGGKMFAEDGKTVTWKSPETEAAYQYIADMFAEGTIPRSALTWDDAGNNTAYQTGRAVFIMNPPSVYSWMRDNDPDLLADTALIAVPKGPGEKGRAASMLSSFSWLVNAKTERAEDAKAWLSYFFQPERYEDLIEVTGGRWVPIYPAMTKTMPLFKDTPAFQNFGEMAATGLVDGFAGPPSALAAEVLNAKILTQSLQKVLADGQSPAEAVAWAQGEIEKLAAKP